ncbi:uncharacterized protein [Coffea arabica]|uniref:Uncharacterized protein isoform X1 n=1 Tax=Coffea arabica TaxID=13443 RepID=A0ABM4WS58_COFAR
MENNSTAGKQVGSASPSSSSISSFNHDLFGYKEPAPTGIFSSIFPPPSSVMGRSGSTSELIECIQGHSARSQVWDKGTPENLAKNNKDESHCMSNKKRSSIFQERAEPCPLSSSLYYGGQEDMYVQSSNAQSLGSYHGINQFKKHWEEDDQNGNDSHSASRGNWWQGTIMHVV